MVECLTAFMDFCYMARRGSHDNSSLKLMEEKLSLFHQLRDVFKDENIRNNFALPRQHALVHYVQGIKLFGSLNGLCTSITESKHIRAVKEPWRRSSRNNPLEQILLINTRLNKIAAARSDFGTHGMLQPNDLRAWAWFWAAKRDRVDDGTQDPTRDSIDFDDDKTFNDPSRKQTDDVFDMDGDPQPASVVMGKKPSCYILLSISCY